jgi:pimeloyl-ACP methyl ester carboxylesterase
MSHRLNTQTDFKGSVSQLSAKLKLTRTAVQALDVVAPRLSTQLVLSHFLNPRHKEQVDYTAQLPKDGERLEIFHNLMKLTGWAWGDTGPAVLLVHGWESHTGKMAGFVKPLLEHGFRVVAFDAPGHGMSPNTPTHLVDYAQAIQSVIEQQGPFYAIIAHSLGAAATTISLQDAPENMPQQLVLLSPMRDLQQQIDIFATVAGLSPKRKDRLNKAVVNHTGRSLDQCSSVNAVRQFNIPGLVIHDHDDVLIPWESGVTIAENWNGARFITTQKLGHRRGLRNQNVLHHVLNFLTTPAQRSRQHLEYADHRRGVEDIGPVIALPVREM